jgi:histidinol-phosphate aminotransferase
MPTFRSDLDSIPVYKPGKPIEEVARELGLDEIVKLASNELPVAPLAPVVDAIAAAATTVNRYPETSSPRVRAAVAEHLGTEPESILVGAGSSALIGYVTMTAGGPGTSIIYADPSFAMYPIGCLVAGSTPVPVPVDEGWNHDLDAMLAAVRGDTTVVFVCNPNNPTGNHISTGALRRFVDAVPDRILVVVDEAYAECVTAGDFATEIPTALQRDNVVVSRTFSKIYGLAGLRIGYLVGRPDTLAAIGRAQPPFTVTGVAQAAALESLRHPDLVAERAVRNAAGRDLLTDELSARGIEVIPSQANFITFAVEDAETVAAALLREGVIVRRLGGLLRVTVGTAAENRAFVDAWDTVQATRR